MKTTGVGRMTQRVVYIICLVACFISLACPSGPSSSAKDKVAGEDQASKLERKIEFLTAIMSRRGLAADVLRDLSAALADHVWLTEVSYDSGKVRIRGNARSNGLVADYIARLDGSQSLRDVSLVATVQKGGRNTAYQEFSAEGMVREKSVDGTQGRGVPPGSDTIAALTARLADLEKSLPEGKDTAGALRRFQQAANDSGLKITKFAPGSEIRGEFYREWPISIEATGSRQNLRLFFNRMTELPELWLIREFSSKALSGLDEYSPIRATIVALTHLTKDAVGIEARHRSSI
jgi:Tfp pilus assembly protein PilN